MVDTDLFEAAAEEFKRHNSAQAAQKLLDLYKGEYLAGFEAFWAVGKRLRYAEIFENALSFSLSNSSSLRLPSSRQ